MLALLFGWHGLAAYKAGLLGPIDSRRGALHAVSSLVIEISQKKTGLLSGQGQADTRPPFGQTPLDLVECTVQNFSHIPN